MILGVVPMYPMRHKCFKEMHKDQWKRGMEIGEQFRAKAAVDCWGMAQGMRKRKSVTGNILRKGSQS